MKAGQIEAYSAGIELRGLDAYAVKVMTEAGVDISSHHSKHLDELKDIDFNYVITLCNSAHENCPIFPGRTKIIHVGFDDPPQPAKQAKSQEEALEIYCCVRDEISSSLKPYLILLLQTKEL